MLAAARAKIKKIILPERNRNDWAEIPAEVRQKIKVHFVDQIADVLRVALHPKTACKS